jgi:hypothetical protein
MIWLLLSLVTFFAATIFVVRRTMGDYSAASMEDRPEDSAYDEEDDDFNDADVPDVDDDDDDEEVVRAPL